MHCNPVNNQEDDDNYLNDEDDYPQNPRNEMNDDDDYEESEEKKRSSTTSSPSEAEIYTTEEKVEVVDAGKSITLSCIGKGIDENTIYLWYKDQSLLFQGTTSKYSAVNAYPRASMSAKDGSLTLSKVDISDDGEYRCRTYPKNGHYEAKIKLMVNGPPSNITIEHNLKQGIDISNQKLSYKVAEKDVRFKCIPSKAHPKAVISWNHNGNVIQESKDIDITTFDDGLLKFRTLHAKHSGKYECVASNEYGSIKAQFELDVQCEILCTL